MNRNRFATRKVTRVHNRTALRTLLIQRDKPLTETDFASLANSYGLTIEQVRILAAEVRAGRSI